MWANLPGCSRIIISMVFLLVGVSFWGLLN